MKLAVLRAADLAAVLFAVVLGVTSCRGTARTLDAPPASARTSPGTPRAIEWLPWTDDLFERARREDRLILLDLEAVWCHWCHVMEETTYADPEVVERIAERYLAVKVDQDSRPDLSNRYEDYGWPATIVLRADGVELAKRSGYIPPAPMASMLAAFANDPTPGPSAVAAAAPAVSATSALDASLRAELEALHTAQFDHEKAGFGFGHKWLDPASVEYSLERGRRGDSANEQMARRTLDAALALIDPVWGGVYQYSTGGDWKEPHFEKIMSFQADDLRIYALAYAAYGEQRYLDAAQAIHRFLREFLTSPEGAFFTSMDADLVPGEHSVEYFALSDAERRARGIPRVDTHVYARENGWAIRGLASLYAYAGDESAVSEARRAAEWIVTHRALEGGGFRHDEVDAAGPYLGDTLAMGRAFLSLYEATGERIWLSRAEEASRFIGARFAGARFAGADAGYSTAASALGPALAAPPNRGENLELARFANLLFRIDGDDAHRKIAERAMRWVISPALVRRPFASGVLLADLETANEPLHVVVVAKKDDPAALALFRAALTISSGYRVLEWFDPFDPVEVPTSGDIEFPTLDRAAAFACSGGRCSSPAFSPQDVLKRAAALER